MRIKPYPEFAEVFDDPALEGFFFPLCTVSLMDEKEDALSIHVVSSQGLWHNPNSVLSTAKVRLTPFICNSINTSSGVIYGPLKDTSGWEKSFAL
jgi:hypothetical protein